MENILIAGGKARLCISEAGFFHLRWMPGSQVDAEDAAASIEAMRRLGAGRALPLLVEISAVTMSAAARGAFERAQAVSAVALVGSSVVDTVVAAALGRHSFCPHAYFVSGSEAAEWLAGLPSREGEQPRPAPPGTLGPGSVVGAAHPGGHKDS
ncbi:STAS/SEC14 domain-containing protein [Arthrobacter sp. B3I4]|uniref:DUF7793 family protein n=1 Tax=Arthrobacter sp. B3I4 TaxID=3042267 RepID=UPI002784AD3E|nr:STAS/SEC14 domain-containing protein [Arthrobacter sp. B3I4]MDQ0756241.1 hypothetical protein [Arthrobacter sp. B3I4]